MKQPALLVCCLVGLGPVSVGATAFQPLMPERVTLDNGVAAIRCATLSLLAQRAGFFEDVENGATLVQRLNTRMLEIAQQARPDATQADIEARMEAAFAAYQDLATDGDTRPAGEAMKADFMVCLERGQALFGPDLLPDE